MIVKTKDDILVERRKSKLRKKTFRNLIDEIQERDGYTTREITLKKAARAD
jgi:hypothetical protein